MAVKFTELLDANRLRPLWGNEPRATAVGSTEPLRQTGQTAARDEAASAPPPPARVDENLDPNSAPLEPLPRETPLEILNKLEQLLKIVLGPQAMLLGIYIQPLRLALARLSGTPQPVHPLQMAFRTGNLPMLIYRLEDSIRGLLRLQQRLSR